MIISALPKCPTFRKEYPTILIIAQENSLPSAVRKVDFGGLHLGKPANDHFRLTQKRTVAEAKGTPLQGQPPLVNRKKPAISQGPFGLKTKKTNPLLPFKVPLRRGQKQEDQDRRAPRSVRGLLPKISVLGTCPNLVDFEGRGGREGEGEGFTNQLSPGTTASGGGNLGCPPFVAPEPSVPKSQKDPQKVPEAPKTPEQHVSLRP